MQPRIGDIICYQTSTDVMPITGIIKEAELLFDVEIIYKVVTEITNQINYIVDADIVRNISRSRTID